MPSKILDLPAGASYVLPGNRACAGCGIGIALRQITAALEGRMVMTVPASCLTVLGGMHPISSVDVPWVNVAFPSTAAAASAARRRRKNRPSPTSPGQTNLYRPRR